jgi:hypothetical protein
MSATVHVAPVLLGLLATLLIAAFRLGAVYPTSLNGAVAAIESIHDWAKWMAGIQTAAIAGLTYFVFEKDSVDLRQLPGLAPTFVFAAYLYLGAALLVSAWVLSSTPSQVLRAHAIAANAINTAALANSAPSVNTANTIPVLAALDVYEQPIYGWAKFPTLGYLLTLQHWLWVLGLAGTAGLFASLLFQAG